MMANLIQLFLLDTVNGTANFHSFVVYFFRRGKVKYSLKKNAQPTAVKPMCDSGAAPEQEWGEMRAPTLHMSQGDRKLRVLCSVCSESPRSLRHC